MSTPKMLHPYAVPSRTDFLDIVRGEGALVWDSNGTEYVDALAALWFCNAGHGVTEIADAVAAQMGELAAFHTFELFANPTAERLAAMIAERAPFDDARVFFGNSGSEAVESAIKFARNAHVRAGHPERTLIVSRDRAYHGVNMGGTSAQGLPLNKEGFGPLVGDIMQVPADDIEAMAMLFSERGHEIAAVMTEPVQGAAGVYPPPPGYLAGLRKLCDAHGAYLIFDEVITGFGRLGTWTAAEHYGVTPDMVTFAKAVSSGYLPIGGVMVNGRVQQDLAASQEMFRHGYTYSGHPAAAAAAIANIEFLQANDLLNRAQPIGERISAGLSAMADDGSIAEVRGVGAIWAARCQPGVDAMAVRASMIEAGVIPRAIGDVVAFCPPLVITDDQIDRCIDVFAAALVAKR